MESGEGADFPSSKIQSDTSSTSTSDFPGKKLARQLLFTASCVTSTSAVSPEHSQLSPAQAHLQRLPQTSGQPQPRPPETLMLLSPQPSYLPLRAVKPESPVSRGRPNVEVKESTPKKQKQCNCKHSRCLKLYCECFASGIYCDGCNCVNCYNNVDNDAARREAVEATLERNPQAFRPKIASSPHGKWEKREEVGEAVVLGRHNKGCHCKKSGCLKKYCECFQANILCSDNCKCMDCKNFESSEERQALFHGDHANSFACIQQAANAAITGAVGSSGYGSPPVYKKRKAHELFFGPTPKDSSLPRLPQFQQPNHVKNLVPPGSPAPVGRVCSNPTAGPSKFTYRSLLADIIQPSYLKELCSVLVVLSGEAAKKLADKNSATEKKGEQIEDSIGCSSQEQVQRQKDSMGDKAGDDGCSSRSQGEKVLSFNDSSSNDAQKRRPVSPDTLALMCDERDTIERPMSPGTLALMCDEQYTISAAASPTEFTGHGCTTTSSQQPYAQNMTQVYVEQERLILTKFRDYLNRLITFGEIKEIKCSSSANSESGSQKEQISNGDTTLKSDKPKHHHQPISNGSVQPSPSSITQSFAENGDVKPKIEEL